MPQYSVVVPVYNGANTIKVLYQKTADFFVFHKLSFEIIYVDDASADNSWQILKELKSENTNTVKIFKLARNAGQQKATLCGINQANGKFIITIDDDLQTDPFEIKKLIDHQQETNADLVYGTYVSKKHSWFRNIGSKVVNWLFHKFSSTYHSGSSFRLIKKEITQNLKNIYQKRLLLDEILCWYTDSISHTTVEHHSSLKVKSEYSTLKLMLMTISYIISYTIIPLRLMTYMGLLFSIVTFFFGLYFIYQKLFSYAELGFTSLIVAISFSTSLILFALGIIGEYITRLYSKDSSKPIYVIKEYEA
jgi:undecaprenyl-phosphate 4-deoxy-4-formamido-L-arabinose transferase